MYAKGRKVVIASRIPQKVGRIGSFYLRPVSTSSACGNYVADFMLHIAELIATASVGSTGFPTRAW